MPEGAKPPAAPGLRGRLFREARAHPRLLVPAIAFPVLAGGAAVLRAWLLARGMNAVVLEGAPVSELSPYILGVFLISVAHALFRYLGGAFPACSPPGSRPTCASGWPAPCPTAPPPPRGSSR